MKSDLKLKLDLLGCFHTNWCDPLLTGEDKVLIGDRGKYDCQDIERLLLAIMDRMESKLGIAKKRASGARRKRYTNENTSD